MMILNLALMSTNKLLPLTSAANGTVLQKAAAHLFLFLAHEFLALKGVCRLGLIILFL